MKYKHLYSKSFKTLNELDKFLAKINLIKCTGIDVDRKKFTVDYYEHHIIDNLDKDLDDVQELGAWDTVSYMKNKFNGKKALKVLWKEEKRNNKETT